MNEPPNVPPKPAGRPSVGPHRTADRATQPTINPDAIGPNRSVPSVGGPGQDGPGQDGPGQHRSARPHRRRWWAVAGAIVAASIVGFGCGYGASLPHSGDASSVGQAG